MARTVVGLFDDPTDADAVVRELIDSGAKREHISVIRTGSDSFARTYGSGTTQGTTTSGAAVGGTTTSLGGLLSSARSSTLPGIGSVHASGPLAATLNRTATGNSHVLIDELTERGIAQEDARFYAEGVRRGGTLILLRVHDEDVDDVADIMSGHGAIDIHSRASNWRTRGWTDFDLKATPFTDTEFTKERELCRTGLASTGTAEASSQTGDIKIPIIEEEIEVGKRRVDRGGVRIVQEVRERPVEETIRLREERVRVERRPVDRAISPDQIDNLGMKDRTIELRETSEEAVVDKRARVKEEVVVHKETSVREEKVRDKVRSTDVRVENTQGSDVHVEETRKKKL